MREGRREASLLTWCLDVLDSVGTSGKAVDGSKTLQLVGYKDHFSSSSIMVDLM